MNENKRTMTYLIVAAVAVVIAWEPWAAAPHRSRRRRRPASCSIRSTTRWQPRACGSSSTTKTPAPCALPGGPGQRPMVDSLAPELPGRRPRTSGRGRDGADRLAGAGHRQHQAGRARTVRRAGPRLQRTGFRRDRRRHPGDHEGRRRQRAGRPDHRQRGQGLAGPAVRPRAHARPGLQGGGQDRQAVHQVRRLDREGLAEAERVRRPLRAIERLFDRAGRQSPGPGPAQRIGARI